MIRIEVVSSYFGYTEEYVLNKTPFWLNRKFKQADRERYDQRINTAYGVFQGISLALDAVFNKGKGSKDILLSYEDAVKRMETEENPSKKDDTFVKEIWWKKSKA